ncbi:DNA (cytosine-5)-methyltransferase 1 [Lachnotalea glycerini]|uniref:Cytosine-specific methyltransferase n=2 Tax=Lachnotalea glycerini TaxID=1763509 RepID=A0A318ENH4_9FIRM|nr:DNA (cytosine-5-)-methyltransferase [Lachnotalea glycerini]PXV86848.1 DNA (cytosine-5)-methyltransferase 1 [Lachnotalea glycerini]
MEYVIDKSKVHIVMEKKNIKTQSELAEKLGVTKNQLSVILSANSNPLKSNYQKLCDVLEVKPMDIIIPKEIVEKKKKDKITGSRLEYVDVTAVKASRHYNSVELFAGAGGLALGLEMAGFHAQGLIEIDKYAAQTLRENRPKWNVIEDDIVKVSENGVRNYLTKNCEIDFVSGGYPCQAFSYAGHKLGLDDVRGTMFFYFAKVIKDLNPKVFLAENVKGLTTHDNGKTLQTMITIYENMGYNVTWNILKANNYGVAQKRERVVIIGIRKDIDIQYRLPKEYAYKPVLKDALKNVPESIGEKYPDKKRKVLELVPPGGYWRDLPENIAKEYMGKSYYSGGGRTGMARRISWEEPSLTLTCSPAQKQTERCHPNETRPFTVREYARIQSFPDEWKFSGSMGQQYKQIGNAVPVEFAKAVGLSIIDLLNKAEG